MLKRVLISLSALVFIAVLTLLVILYGRGYRFDTKDKKITGTGILSVSSYPEKASILINDKLQTATNASLTLSPAWYDVKIAKEGYQNWEKKIRIQAEVVSTIDALLLPANPSLRAITTTGIHSPTLSPSGDKVAYIVIDEATASAKPKTGLYLQDLRSGPLGNKAEQRALWTPQFAQNWNNGTITWSFDEKQVLLTFTALQTNPKKAPIVSKAYLFNVQTPDALFIDVTNNLEETLQGWEIERKAQEELTLSNIPKLLTSFLSSSSAEIQLSVDDSKILYLATGSAVLAPLISPPLIGTNPTSEIRTTTSGKYYVYDIKEDKNFYIADKSQLDTQKPAWYSDSKHIVLVEKNAISFVDYDGTNKRNVYTGPFVSGIAYPWPSGGKLIILTNFNNVKSPPNFYEVDLR